MLNNEHTIIKNNSIIPTSTTINDTSEIFPIPTMIFDSLMTTPDSTSNLSTIKPSSKILPTTTITTTTTTTTINNRKNINNKTNHYNCYNNF